MEPKITSDWSGGANNLAPADRLPDGQARHLVNLDPLPGGKLGLRTGYAKVYTGSAIRGVLTLDHRLLIADGGSLVEYNTSTSSHRVLRSIAASGAFTGEVLNGVLYFSTANELLCYDGEQVRPLAVPDVTVQPSTSAQAGGGLQAGYYQVAMVYRDAEGREGGTERPLVLKAKAGDKLVVNLPAPPAGHETLLYVGALEGQTLYLQATRASADTLVLTTLHDDSQRCDTILCRAPRPGQSLVAHGACLAIANGPVVQLTLPYRPHLVDRVRGFLQYQTGVTALLSVAPMLLVGADKTYGVTGAEAGGAGQVTLLEVPPVPGTAVMLPTLPDHPSKGAFMTSYGQAIFDGQAVRLLTRERYAPAEAASGAAGVLEHNGNQLVVTTLRGQYRPNPLAAADFFIGGIKKP